MTDATLATMPWPPTCPCGEPALRAHATYGVKLKSLPQSGAAAVLAVARDPDLALLGEAVDAYLGHPLKGQDLRGEKLAGARFDRLDLSGAKLDGADLDGATFRHACLRGAQMSNVSARGVSFFGADVGSADFYAADLRDTEFRRVMGAANFMRAQLAGMKSNAGLEGNFIGALADKRMLAPQGYYLNHGELMRLEESEYE